MLLGVWKGTLPGSVQHLQAVLLLQGKHEASSREGCGTCRPLCRRDGKLTCHIASPVLCSTRQRTRQSSTLLEYTAPSQQLLPCHSVMCRTKQVHQSKPNSFAAEQQGCSSIPHAHAQSSLLRTVPSHGLQDSGGETDADEAPKKKRKARTPKELKSPQSEKAPRLARAGRRFTAAELQARAEKRELTAIEVGLGRYSTVTLVSSPLHWRRQER